MIGIALIRRACIRDDCLNRLADAAVVDSAADIRDGYAIPAVKDGIKG
jgi:hypothetical protein